ncbi:MAG: hypothetical protein PHV18_15120 [Lachnospiraceae bacterium]|nr:hypothetical protein [Lachnospiraceae bacterium]
MYNVKVSEYLDSVEVSLYETPIHGHKKESDGIVIERNDESLEIYRFMAFQCDNKKESDAEENALHSYFVSFNRTKNKIYNYARANKWDWFLTFTFNPELVDSYNYDEVVFYMSDFLLTMTSFSRCGHGRNRMLKYLIVPEKHKSGRYHLHGVFSGIDLSLWKMTFSEHFTKGGLPIFNVGCFPYGFTTATQVQNTTRCAHYISKYITKDMFDSIKNRKRYWVTHNCSDGEHNSFYMSPSEIKILLDSFGECQYMKSVQTPYNSIKYFQF